MSVKQVQEDECVPCKLGAGVGMALGVCSILDKEKVDCDKLEKDLQSGSVTPDQAFDMLIKVCDEMTEPIAKEAKEDLMEIRRLMNEPGSTVPKG